MHDYIIFDDDWYNGFLKYGNDFDIVVNKIINTNGTRFRDWILNFDFLNGMYFKVNENASLHEPYSWEKHNNGLNINIPNNRPTIFLDYDDNGEKWQNYIYISGSFFICKKYVMDKYPLNERLLHNQGEDVEWSQRVRPEYKFSCNKYSTVNLLKYKSMTPPIIVK